MASDQEIASFMNWLSRQPPAEQGPALQAALANNPDVNVDRVASITNTPVAKVESDLQMVAPNSQQATHGQDAAVSLGNLGIKTAQNAVAAQEPVTTQNSAAVQNQAGQPNYGTAGLQGTPHNNGETDSFQKDADGNFLKDADGNFIPATAQTDQSVTTSSSGKPVWQAGSMETAQKMAALNPNAKAVDDPRLGPVVEWNGGGNGIELTKIASDFRNSIYTGSTKPGDFWDGAGPVALALGAFAGPIASAAGGITGVSSLGNAAGAATGAGAANAAGLAQMAADAGLTGQAAQAFVQAGGMADISSLAGMSGYTTQAAQNIAEKVAQKTAAAAADKAGLAKMAADAGLTGPAADAFVQAGGMADTSSLSGLPGYTAPGAAAKTAADAAAKTAADAAKNTGLTSIINKVSAGGLSALTADDLAKLAGWGISGAAIYNQITSGAKPSDIVAAATTQGQVNKDFQTATLQGSNPNINNPYGSQSITWTKDPVTGNMVPTVSQKYNADQQAILDNQTATKKADGLLALGAANQAKTALSSPLDLSKAPALGSDYTNARKSVIDAYMSRANEDYNKATDNNQSNMIAAGIRPGSKAYGDQQQMTERARNDAYQQAEIAGGNAVAQANTTSLQNHQAGVTDILTARNQPITELNNLNATTNSAPAPLSFQAFSPAVVAAPNVQQATLDANNMQQQQTNNTTNGLLGLGKTLLTGP